MNKILVTGGSGFIGDHLLEAISGDNVVNYDILEPLTPRGKYIKGDILDFDLIKKSLEGISSIIHLAATHFDFQKNYFKTNVDGTLSLIRAAEAQDVKKIIFVSTVATYGKIDKPTGEDDETLPNMPYGQSKLEAENLLSDWAAKGTERSLVIIRPTVVYGPNNFGNVFNLIKQIDSGFYFHIGEGTNVKSVAYVSNLVENIIQLLTAKLVGVHIYNNSDEPHMTTRQLADHIAKCLGKEIRFSLTEGIASTLAKPFDLLKIMSGREFVISTSRIKKFCASTHFVSNNYKSSGINQKHNTLEGLEETIRWYKNTNWKPRRENWLNRVSKYN